MFNHLCVSVFLCRDSPVHMEIQRKINTKNPNSLLKHRSDIYKYFSQYVRQYRLQLVVILSSSGCSLMRIHVADMNTDTLVVFWLIWLVCWLMGSVCVSILGAGVFLDLRKVPGPFCVPSKLLPVKNFKCFLLQVN